MKQFTPSDNNQLSALLFHQQAELSDYPIAPALKGYARDNSLRENLPNESSAQTNYQSFTPGYDEREVENQHQKIRSDQMLFRYRAELKQLSMRLLTIQENERQRIAADLHDGIGQSLSLLMLSLESVMQKIKVGETQDAMESLQQLNHTVKETMKELHRTTMDLCPSMLENLGIVPTLSWFLREFEQTWGGNIVEKEISILENDIPVPLKVTIFRILQEATNNVVKHASANRIRVSLKITGELLQFSIEDNGCGFDLNRVTTRCSPEYCSFGCGFGLLTMKERARSSGGTLKMKSTSESGTKIFISWHIANDAAVQNIENSIHL